MHRQETWATRREATFAFYLAAAHPIQDASLSLDLPFTLNIGASLVSSSRRLCDCALSFGIYGQVKWVNSLRWPPRGRCIFHLRDALRRAMARAPCDQSASRGNAGAITAAPDFIPVTHACRDSVRPGAPIFFAGPREVFAAYLAGSPPVSGSRRPRKPPEQPPGAPISCSAAPKVCSSCAHEQGASRARLEPQMPLLTRSDKRPVAELRGRRVRNGARSTTVSTQRTASH